MSNIFLFARLLLAVSLLLLAGDISPAHTAATQDLTTNLPGPTKLIRLDPVPNPRYVSPPAAYQQSLVSPNIEDSATIVVNYIGNDWTAEAIAAFEFAAGIWETLISSGVSIVVDAEFGPLGPGILGGAGPIDIERNFPNAPQSDTWVPAPFSAK